MERARVIFSAPSGPQELSVMKPQSCSVQRSPSRTFRTPRAQGPWTLYRHWEGKHEAESEICCPNHRVTFTAIRPVKFNQTPLDKSGLHASPALACRSLRLPASPAGPVPSLCSAVASLHQLSICYRWWVSYAVRLNMLFTIFFKYKGKTLLIFEHTFRKE